MRRTVFLLAFAAAAMLGVVGLTTARAEPLEEAQVEESGSGDASGGGGGLGGVLLLIGALVVADRVWRVHGPRRRRPKISGSARKPKVSASKHGTRHVSRDVSQERQVELLLRRGETAWDDVNYMSGPEFERFMADVLRRQGYAVEETPLSGDQGVDLVLPDFDGKRVVVQLKRWTGPVGNGAVQATFAGMAHYRAKEGWIITTSTFTKSARELARSTRVRLIDGKELAQWLEGLKEHE